MELNHLLHSFSANAILIVKKNVSLNSVEIGSKNHKICEVYSSKVLGFSVDNKLNLKIHINAPATKLCTATFALSKN